MPRRPGSLRRLARTLKRLAAPVVAAPLPRPTAMEALEPRILYAAPQFNGDLFNQLIPTTGVLGLTFGIDGFDADGDNLTITAVSDDPKLTTYVTSGNRFAKINFKKADNSALGSILVELFDDRAPTATQRFVDLATKGYNPNGTVNPSANPFYTNIIVHRVVPGFVIQTGDATGTGNGDSPLPDFNPQGDTSLSFAGPGALAWANSGNNPATSNGQFFITAAPATSLDAVFNPFGQIISGWDIYDQIIASPTNANSEKPTSPPVMTSVEILNSTQDASVTLKSTTGWDGQAEVTITLNDGTNTVIRKIQAVSNTILGNPPSLVGVNSPAKITPGADVVFDYAIQDTPNLGATVTAFSDVSTATVTVNATNETINVDTPDAYQGLIQVLTQAKEANFDPRVLTQPGSQIFSIFSVTSSHPTPLSHLPTGSTGAALSTKYVGNRLWVANSTGGIEVYDATNLNAPVLLKRHTLLNTAAQRVQARDIEIIGNTAVVTTNNGGTYVLDVSNLNNIQIKTRITFDTTNTDPNLRDDVNSRALQVAAVGNIIYVTEFTNGMAAYNVADPANIQFLGKVKTSNGKTIEQAMDMAIVGNTAYVTDQKGFVFTVDITNPAAMTIQDQVSAGVAPWGIAYRDNKLYVADQGLITNANNVSTVVIAGRLLVLDVTEPTNPTVIGQRTVEGAPWQVTLVRDTAIVSTQRLPLVGGSTGGTAPVGKAVSFVDVTDANAMTILREFDASSIAGRLDVKEGALAVPLGLAGVALMQMPADLVFSRTTVYTDGNGAKISVRATQATVEAQLDGAGNISVLRINATGPKASVTILSKDGDAQIGDILVTGSLKSLVGKTTDLLGDLLVTGTVDNVQIDDVAGDSLVRFTASGGKLIKFRADQVRDLSIESSTAFASITVNDWQNQTTRAETITAPYINKLTSKGDFEAGMVLSGTGSPNQVALGKAAITGSLSGKWRVIGHSYGVAAGSTTATFAASFAGELVAMTLRTGDLRGILTVGSMRTLKVRGALNEAKLYAGTELGSDIALGGAGAAADTFRAGLIRTISITGQIIKSTILVGANSAGTNAIGGSISELKSLRAAGMDADSRVKAGALPRTVKAGTTILTSTDTRFAVLPPPAST